MIVRRFVIHELIKNKAPKISPKLLDLENEFVAKLANNIVEVYHQKVNVVWGRFKPGGEFPAEVKKLADVKVGDGDFKKLAVFSMERLHVEMESTAGTGGYICFIEYKRQGCNYFMVAMIKNTDGIKLDGLVPIGDIHVDLARLYQAININFDLYFKSLKEELNKSYLGFIGKKGDPSDYFTDAFSGTDKVNPVQAVTKTHRALQSFLDQYTEDKTVKREAHDTLVSYLNENINKTVSLDKVNEIANAFLPKKHADKKNKFIEYAKSDAWQIPDNFQAAASVVNRLAKIRVSEDDFSLVFRRTKLGVKGNPDHKQRPIIFDEDNKSVIITGLSADAIASIKEEIERSVQK